MVVDILSLLIALIHIYFFVLESMLYTKPRVRKIFGMTHELAEITKVWAFNQGYYNLFLGLGLIVALITNTHVMLMYLLLFIVMVGIVGALSVKPKIFWFQAFPAIITLGLMFI